MKVIDLRDNEYWEIGNSMELLGDYSRLCITTDKGYRLIIDAYNMKRIADYYKQEGVDENHTKLGNVVI